eukprot:265365_1
MNDKGWDLLYYRNIARHASGKQIKKFVKSLDVKLLRQILEIYTDSIISPLRREYEAMSASKTLKHWKEGIPHEEELGENDIQILHLLTKHCGNKRASMYQNQSTLLRALPMEIMSYSFSFLSFQELSSIQRVCLYFMTSSRKYR